MIIGIDIRMLAGGNRTGVEEYTCRLLENMLPQNKNIDFRLFYSGYKKHKLGFDWINLPNVTIVDLKFPNRILDSSFRFFDYPKMENLIGKIDKFFSPHIFFSNKQKNCEKIVTFHDLSFEKYPEFYSKGKNFWHFSMNPKKQALDADKIIAVSNSTKQDLIDIYGIQPNKIKTIYSGLNLSLTQPISEEQKEKVKRKYKIDKDYILYFGTLEPRKNISSLIRAFAQSKKDGRLENSDIKLVIAGTKGWLYEEIFQVAKETKINSEIIFTEFVEEEDKASLYSIAKLFIYPSFYEGFGFPPLEAMIQGTPVITSNISSIPEAVENAALLINPSKIDELKDAIEKVLLEQKLAKELSERGLQITKKFQWEKCAKETIEYIIE